jgi:hypothetical protein
MVGPGCVSGGREGIMVVDVDFDLMDGRTFSELRTFSIHVYVPFTSHILDTH